MPQQELLLNGSGSYWCRDYESSTNHKVGDFVSVYGLEEQVGFQLHYQKLLRQSNIGDTRVAVTSTSYGDIMDSIELLVFQLLSLDQTSMIE